MFDWWNIILLGLVFEGELGVWGGVLLILLEIEWEDKDIEKL